LYPGPDMNEADLRSELEAALKRAAPGFLKTVGLWHPSEEPVADPYGGMSQPISSWQMVREQLRQSYTIKTVDLSSGRVPGDVDVLAVIAPQGMTDKERFAVDQYLMRGGAIVVVAGNYILSPQQFGGNLIIEAVQDGLKEMLAHYGVTVGDALVMDPRSEPFPIQVQRSVAGMTVLEYRQIPFPFFVDVRRDSMATESPVVANLQAVTLHWASPVEVDAEKTKDLDLVTLLESTDASWLRTSIAVQPDLNAYPELGFPVEGEQKSRALAVSLRGSFESYFKDRPSPFLEGEAPAGTEETATGEGEDKELALATIEVSPESSRLVVIGSAEFVDDAILQISSRFSQDRYLNNLQFLQNAVDWSVEDEDLLSIRSGGTYARLLKPMKKGEQSFWEGLNYALALLAVIGIGVVWNIRQRSEEPMTLVAAETASAEGAKEGGER
ncbi:MAG: Gldg family protein, partial [Anaerolineae bacterium]